jgi:hypothetical protein
MAHLNQLSTHSRQIFDLLPLVRTELEFHRRHVLLEMRERQMSPGSRSIVRFQLLRSCLTSESVTPASARYTRFHLASATCRIAT